MAASFNLTAQLNLRGPSNIRNIVSNIRRQLGTISGDINFNINPSTTRNVAQLNSALQGLNQTFAQTVAAARNASTAIAAFSNAANAGNINNVATNLNNVSTAANNTAQSVTRASRQTAIARTEMEEFGRQSALAVRRFAAFSVSTGAIVGLSNAIRKGIAAFIEYDRQLVVLQQVTGESANGLAKLSSTVTSLSTGLGVASSDLLSVSSTLAQAGLSARDTERALKALALSALAPSFDNLNKTVEGSIALMRQFGISAKDLESSLGSVNAVAAAFAVESADIIAAIQRTGGVFAAASKGVSEGTQALNEFIAIFTSVRQTTRESAETIATGLRTIFTRIQRGGTIEALKEFGVNLTDVEGKFVGAYRAVQLLSEGLNRIDPRDIKFSQIVEELGGFRQIGKVIPLIQQFATAQQALAVAQAGAGSLAEDAAIAQLSLANKITKVREEFLALFREIGSSDSFQTIARGALDVASALIRVADSVKGVLPVLGIMMAMRGASAITQFGAGFIGGIRRGGGAAGLGGRMAGGFASGGYVPGTGNRDTVPAMLTPGEFVIRKKAVEKIGVGRLARLNRNNGGSIPTQYFEDGGSVQRFKYGGSPKKGIDWKSLSKGRGKKGSRGPRARFELPQPGEDTDFAKWQRQIYAEYDADPSLPRVKYNGIPMPPEIAYANKLISEEVFRQNFGSSRRKKSGKLKKTPLGLIFSAAKMPRGPRAPAGEMEKIMAGYQASPEFQKQTSGAGSSLFASLKGPLASFKKGGNFGGVITPGSENATKIKGALGKLLSQSSGQDAVKAKTALDKFDSFISGGTPEKAGHVSHFTWAMNQIFKKGIATFGRGGRASSRMGVFDFDMTTGITKQKETPSLSGFRDPKLAVPDILSATPTGLVQLMKRYGASQILTARSGGPKGEMRTALGTFFRRNGVMLPSSSITTLGDQVGSLSTAEKKARALYAMVKKYGGVDFFDDDQANIDAAKMVRGVSARKVSVMKNLGGAIQKFAVGGEAMREKMTREERILQGMRGGQTKRGKQIYNFGVAALRAGSGKKEDVSFFSSPKSGELSKTFTEQFNIPGTPPKKGQFFVGTLATSGFDNIVESTLKQGTIEAVTSAANILGSQIGTKPITTTSSLNRIFKGSGFQSVIGSGLEAAIAMIGSGPYIDKTESTKSFDFPMGIGSAAKLFGIPGNIPTDATRTIGGFGKSKSKLEKAAISFVQAVEGGEFTKARTEKAAARSVGNIQKSGMMESILPQIPQGFNASATAFDIRTKYGLSRSGLTVRGLPGSIAIAARLGREKEFLEDLRKALPTQRRASGGEIKGISSSRAREAILGKQLNGVEMIKAARKAGYDIEELDDGMIQLSRNNKVAHTLTRAKASELLGSMSTGYNLGGSIQKFAKGGSSEDTVPALLTPGEFVINKKAAKRIGSAKLNRLNKADKISGFNKGGIVGGVQKFATGGFTEKNFAGSGVGSALGTKGIAIIDAAAQKSGPAFNRLITAVDDFGATILSSNPKQAAAQLKAFARALEKGKTETEALGAAITAGNQSSRRYSDASEKAAKKLDAENAGITSRTRQSGRSLGVADQRTAQSIVASRVAAGGLGRSGNDMARLQRESDDAAKRLRAFFNPEAAGKALKVFEGTLIRTGGNLTAMRAAMDAGIKATRDAANKQQQQRANIVQSFGGSGSFGGSRISAAMNWKDFGARAGAARAPTSASSFSALAAKDTATLGDGLSVLGNKIKNLNLSALQKFGSAMATVNTKLAQGGQAINTLRTSLANTGGAFSRFSTTLRQNPFKAIQQAAGGVSGAFSKITTALSTATAAVTSFGKRAGAPQPPGSPDAPDRPDRPSAGQRLQSAAFGLSFAIPMLADMMTVAEPKNAQQAATNAQMTGISTAVGSATMLASMGPLGMIAAIPTAVGGIVKAFADAKNAAHEFNKQAQSTKLEEALEKAGTALDNYSKNVKDTAAAEKARAAVLKANQEARTLSTMQQEPRASMVGMVADYFGAVPQDNMAMQRSQILEQKGVMSYLGSIGFGGGDAAATTSVEFRSLIPQLAKENAKTFQGAAEASTRFLETQFKSGQTVDSMAASGQLNEFGRSLALADVKVQEYMMAVDNTVGLSDAQKNAMKENIIATQTEAKAREIQTRALREKALETLNRQTTQLQNSLERMFQNMEQAINSNAYSLSKLSDSAELTAASLSGAARAGTVRVDAINALNNPRGVSVQQRNAAVTQAASMFGSQAPEMEGVLKLSGMLENTLMSTINNTIKAANASGTAVTQEAIGAKLESSINQALSDLKLPPELATGLSREVKDAVQKMRTSGEDQVDFSEIINQVPQLGRVLESSRRAQELANKALEYWQQNLNEYANAMNNLVETQVDINSRLRRSTDILISGQLALGKALGQSVSLQTSVALIDQKRAAQTPGGVTDPNTIGLNIRNLERLRSTQEAQAQEAAQKGFGGKDEFVNMQNNLANTNLALRENYASLKDMSENTDKANAAMERISELRAKTQAGAGIAERLVTSSPQELANLNRSMALLNNNMRGGLNVGSTAEDRKGVLDVFNMIAPFLGERQDALKANVLESMLRESGIGVNNMMQGVLDSLRNPAGDPQMAQAINIYNQGVNEQVKANQQLANLAAIMNDNNAEIAAQKIATAIQGVQLSFETQTLSNINDGIQQLVGIAQQKPPGNVAGAIGIAKGGIVYAAEGQHISFKTKGTDTVPAMLTPGEFVVNRSATQKNLPLLQSINNGYQKGGKVSYYQGGGLVFGGRWGLAQNMDNQSRINAGPELESKEKLTGLNWNQLIQAGLQGTYSLKPIPKNNKLLSLSGLPYYAGNKDSPKSNIDSLLLDYKNSSGSIPGTEWLPGRYIKSFEIKSMLEKLKGEDYGSLPFAFAGMSLSNIDSSSSQQTLSALDIPNLDWIKSINASPQNLSFSPNNANILAELIFDALEAIPKVKKDTNSVTIKGERFLFSKPGSNDSIGPANPTYDVKYDERSGVHTVRVDNLTKAASNDKYITDNLAADSYLKGVTKSLVKHTPLFGQLYKGFTRLGLGARFGGRPTLDIGSRNKLGSDAGSIYDAVIDKAWKPSELQIPGLSPDPGAEFDSLINFRATLENAYNVLNRGGVAGRGQFVETQASLSRKNMINKMRNLLGGSSFREIFDATEIAGGVPTTLFNLPDNIWSTLLPFTNSPPGTYATNKSTWVPIGQIDPMGMYTSLGKSFPWIRQGFAEADLNLIMNKEKEFIERVGDLVKITNKEFKTPDMFFPYKQITGPLWDLQKGTFSNNPSSFTVIDTFSGDLNPFKGLQLDTNTQAVLGGRGDINAFVRQLLDSNSKTGKFKLNIASKLSKTNPAINKANYTENTKSNAFINTLTKTMEFEPVEYQKVLDKVKEEQRVAQREQIVGQAAGAAQQAANFDAAKRVALGRLIYKTARQNKIPIRSRIPEDITHLPAVSEALQQAAQNSPSDYVRTLAAGTKTLIDQLADVNNDGSFFLQNGININTAFNPNNALRKNIRLPDGTFLRNAIYDYKDIGISPESILALIQRTGLQTRLTTGLGSGINAAAGLGSVVEDRDKAGLNLKGIKIERVNPETGKLEEQPFVKAGEDVLKWGNLFDAAFNPYAQFPDIQGRQSLFSLFREKFNTATMPGTRRPAFDKRLLEAMNQNLTLLSQWYGRYQDYLINTTDTPDISTKKKTELVSANTKVTRDRDLAQRANLFYTNNKFGELPTYEWLQAKLDQKTNPADAQVKNAVGKATGGLIYASDGALINFQPKGTDTVPAMLTPGEFVVNREATRKHLPLLKNINMATGGVVQYRQNGGQMYDSSSGTFSRSEGVVDQILSKVESGNKINEFTYGNTNKNLVVSRNTNTLAGNINEDTSKLRSSVKNATGYASGGMIYANNGMLVNFQPKGTDTVPAMLSPGEFVVRREATQKHLSLRHAINNNSFSGDSALTLNRGGYIQPAYLSRGGFGMPSLASLPDLVSKMAGGIQSAVEKAITQAFNNIELPSSDNNTGVSTNREIATQIGSFANNLSNLANKLESISIPPEITIQGKQDINVNANGLQILSSLNPSLGKIALNMIKIAIDNLATKNPGTLDFNIEYPQQG